ncbi:MAG: tetratricopeptide repeat protein [Candidatus Cloacimonetes bacterium]|nr:tetratricopeptide repeat protein [Candidatus Cloacimonadota bacterium]
MLRLFPKSNRCRICHSERGNRECPRRNKTIGWHCCNEMRVDLKCPSSCSYAGTRDKEGKSPFPAFKSESTTEFVHAIKLYMDFWIHHPLAALDDNSPAAMAKDEPSKLMDWLGSFRYPASFPMNYLLQKLGLPHQKDSDTDNPEYIAKSYLESVMIHDWQALRDMTINQDDDNDLAIRYQEIISAIPALNRIKHYEIIHAGIADDGITALVYLEVNHRYDWTMIFSNIKGRWLLRQQLAGNPSLFYAQNDVHKSLAEALGAGKDEEAWQVLEPRLPLYPDSADLRYYLALYWQLVKQMDKARVEYFNAMALDNDFYAPAFTLGALYLSENNSEEALHAFEHLALKHPDDSNILNNLGAALAGLGRIDEAKATWQKILQMEPNHMLAKKNLDRYP